MPNWRKETPRNIWYGPEEPKNRFTQGKGGRIQVQPSVEPLRYTYPQPYLTPFDFMLVQCRTLYADLVDFLTAFDEDFVTALEMEGEDFTTFREQALRAYPFVAPLVSREIHVCLINLDHYAKLLATHATQPGDAKRETPIALYNAGRNRRLRLLQFFTSGYQRPDPADQRYNQVRPFWEIVLRLGGIVTTKDPAITARVDLMVKQADKIDTDALRARKLCEQEATGFLFNYEGATRRSAG